MNGLVLAGGESTRIGMDKAIIDYHGQPKYIHVYKLLENMFQLNFQILFFLRSKTLVLLYN